MHYFTVILTKALSSIIPIQWKMKKEVEKPWCAKVHLSSALREATKFEPGKSF